MRSGWEDVILPGVPSERPDDNDDLVPATPADRLVPLLAERLGTSASAAAVFGQPIERDGITIVPVARVRYGFGGGGGAGPDGRGAGSGGGGGAMCAPIGFIEIRDGAARFRPIGGARRLLLASAAGALVALIVSRAITAAR